jgi:hypothetical protein
LYRSRLSEKPWPERFVQRRPVVFDVQVNAPYFRVVP